MVLIHILVDVALMLKLLEIMVIQIMLLKKKFEINFMTSMLVISKRKN